MGPKPARRRNRKRKRRVVSDSSSSEESSSSSSSSGSSDVSTSPRETAREVEKLDTSEDTDTDDSEDESEDNPDLDVQGADISMPLPRSVRPEPPPQRDSPSPQPPVDIPPFVPPHTPESEQMLKEKFRKFWMASIAEGFKDDLEEIRKEPNLGPSRLALLIESLASGADVFSSSSTGGRANEMEVVLDQLP